MCGQTHYNKHITQKNTNRRKIEFSLDFNSCCGLVLVLSLWSLLTPQASYILVLCEICHLQDKMSLELVYVQTSVSLSCGFKWSPIPQAWLIFLDKHSGL